MPARGIFDTSPVQELERFGTLSLVLELGGLISTTPVSTCKTARDDSALLSTIERGHTDGYRHSAYMFTLTGEGAIRWP